MLGRWLEIHPASTEGTLKGRIGVKEFSCNRHWIRRVSGRLLCEPLFPETFLDCLSHRKNKIRGFALLSIFLQLIMRMPMMDVGIVHMSVSQLAVVMDVRVRLTWRIAWLVHVLMMLVVPVKMFVNHCFMVVRVSVPLAKMKPDAKRH